MNFHNFIFSDLRRYRLRRHLIFWMAWTLYFAITFLVPTYWVPAWNLKGPMPQIEKYGVVISVWRILMNSVLMAVVHMALVYGVLYYFLPKYLQKGQNRIIVTALLFLFVIFIACFNYLNFLITFSISTRMGFFPGGMPDMNYIVPFWVRQIIFNYPTVVGFAVGIKLLKRWYIKQKETEQLVKEKINAELLLLKAQVHPHFLFNTLNNIYLFILNGSDEAPGMVKRLSSLLHYIINDCNQPYVPLEKELSMIQDYIALEQIRYGEQLNLSVHIQGSPKNKLVSPLLFLPFVENSFKHGSSRMLTHPWVSLEINIEKSHLDFRLSNNKPGQQTEPAAKKGIGLKNLKKRLELLYPGAHSLRILESEMSFDVAMRIALHTSFEKPEEPISSAINKGYELA